MGWTIRPRSDAPVAVCAVCEITNGAEWAAGKTDGAEAADAEFKGSEVVTERHTCIVTISHSC